MREAANTSRIIFMANVAVAAVATANAHVLTFCSVRAAIVARTCRKLADAVRREWPRTAVALDLVTHAGMMAVKRRDDQLGELARLARPTQLPVEVLRRAIALGRLDVVEWFFTVSDAVNDEARAEMIHAGCAHLLPRDLWPPDVADLTKDALTLTEALIDDWLAIEPDLARHRAAFHHHPGWCWATELMMHRTGCDNRPSSERWTVESADRRYLIPRVVDVIADVESASADYTVEMRHVHSGIVMSLAPLFLLEYGRVELVFTAPESFVGPFRANVTTYVVPGSRRSHGMYRHNDLFFWFRDCLECVMPFAPRAQ